MVFELGKNEAILVPPVGDDSQILIGLGWTLEKPKPVKKVLEKEEERKVEDDEGEEKQEEEEEEEVEGEKREEEEEEEEEEGEGKHDVCVSVVGTEPVDAVPWEAGPAGAASAPDEHEDGVVEEEPVDRTKPEVDAFCALFTKDGRQLEVIDAIAMREGADHSVKHTGDNHDGRRESDDEHILLDLDRVPQQAHSLIIGITTETGISLAEANVVSAYARVLDMARGGAAALRLDRGEPEVQKVARDEHEEGSEAEEGEEEKEEKEEAEEEEEEEDLGHEKRIARIAELLNAAELARVQLRAPNYKPRSPTSTDSSPGATDHHSDDEPGPVQAQGPPHNFALALRIARLPDTATFRQRTAARWQLEVLDLAGQAVGMESVAREMSSVLAAKAKAAVPVAVHPAEVEYSIALIKPHAVLKQRTGAIVEAIEAAGLTVVARQQMIIQDWQAEEVYPTMEGAASLTGGGNPAVALVVTSGIRGPLGLPGAVTTLQKVAAEIKDLYGAAGALDALHAAATAADAEREIRLFFPQFGWSEYVPSGHEAQAFVMQDTALRPVLSEGLAELCKQRPEKPVVWLAEWLLANNPNQPRIEEPE